MTRRAVALIALTTTACGPEIIDHAAADSTGAGSSASGSGGGPADGSTSELGDSGDGSTGSPAPTQLPGDGPYGAGTRLVPMVERSDEDGLTQLIHWFDRDLGTNCNFVRDSVGTFRCMPIDVEGTAVGYADESCSEPVIGVNDCASAPTYASVPVPEVSGCNDGERYQGHRLGVPIGPGYVNQDFFTGACTGASNFAERHELEPLPDETFVAATMVEEQQGDVRVRGLVAEDGAFVRSKLTHPTFGVTCSLSQVQSEPVVLQCLGTFAVPYAFADASCTTPLLGWIDDPTCEDPTQRIGRIDDAWYELGAPWTGPIYGDGIYGLGMPGCGPIDASQANPYEHFEPGPPTDAPAELRLDVVPVGDGRLQMMTLQHEGQPLELTGILGLDTRWFDGLLGEPCRPMPDANGELRCMPLPLVANDEIHQWGDPACTEIPLVRTFESPPTRVSLVDYVHNGCGDAEVTRLQNVVGAWTDAVYDSSGGGCELEPPDNDASFVRLGNYVEVIDAPAMSIVVDAP